MQPVDRPTLHQTYMNVAEIFAQRSTAAKRKVGAVIVNDGIIAEGYNGTPPGDDNICEDVNGKTLPWVIHAEQNALDKLTRSTKSSLGAVLYVTTAPCIECAKRIHGARLSSVFYRDTYKNQDGLDYLNRSGIKTERME